ncbi:MAG: hypothetical protein JSU07_06555 [Bacteroidetes bacterium]|nr:hypothetical protein [Bacteroidota bacterium]
MKKYITYILLFTVKSYVVLAQVLLPTFESAFDKQHRFNPDVIKSKSIKRIIYEISDKKDFEEVVNKKLTETYEFNEQGFLTRYYYTTIAKTIEKQITTGPIYKHRRLISNGSTYSINNYSYDTVSQTYFYNAKNIVLSRYCDGGNYYESKYYRYTPDGFLTKELRYKENNLSKDKSIFILGSQQLLGEDSMQYQKYNLKQVKQITLNNENRPYKETIINLDSIGQTTSLNESYTAAGWITQSRVFKYNNNSRLVKAEFKGNTGNTVNLQITYEYEKNELLTEKHFKNETLVKEISYVSDYNLGLLNSIVIRDPINKSIRIIKLRYEYNSLSNSDKK